MSNSISVEKGVQWHFLPVKSFLVQKALLGKWFIIILVEVFPISIVQFTIFVI